MTPSSRRQVWDIPCRPASSRTRVSPCPGRSGTTTLCVRASARATSSHAVRSPVKPWRRRTASRCAAPMDVDDDEVAIDRDPVRLHAAPLRELGRGSRIARAQRLASGVDVGLVQREVPRAVGRHLDEVEPAPAHRALERAPKAGPVLHDLSAGAEALPRSRSDAGRAAFRTRAPRSRRSARAGGTRTLRRRRCSAPRPLHRAPATTRGGARRRRAGSSRHPPGARPARPTPPPHRARSTARRRSR